MFKNGRRPPSAAPINSRYSVLGGTWWHVTAEQDSGFRNQPKTLVRSPFLRELVPASLIRSPPTFDYPIPNVVPWYSAVDTTTWEKSV